MNEVLAEKATLKEFNEGDLLMSTGQYMRFTMLVVDGLVKVYREGEDGSEFFMYNISPRSACVLSMICSTKQQKREIRASALINFLSCSV